MTLLIRVYAANNVLHSYTRKTDVRNFAHGTLRISDSFQLTKTPFVAWDFFLRLYATMHAGRIFLCPRSALSNKEKKGELSQCIQGRIFLVVI
jgi:hypothetical protein